MPEIVELVSEVAGQLISIRFVAPRLHDPIDNVEPEAGVAKSGFLIEKSPAGNARDIPAFPNYRFQRRGADGDLIVRLGHRKFVFPFGSHEGPGTEEKKYDAYVKEDSYDHAG